MKLKKGLKLIFKDREEIILKASNDPINGVIQTDANTYSTNFIQRWIEFGFVTVKNK